MWIDTHCHLDAPEFEPDRQAVLARARDAGIFMVIPAVSVATLDAVKQAAQASQGAYALGLHPMYVWREPPDALERLQAALAGDLGSPRLVAVGEIGLDFFVPDLQTPEARACQERFYAAQLDMAQSAGLPVILHVRRSADALLKQLRRLAAAGRPVAGGIAHAFNGSEQQAMAFVDLGFKLGFGGAMTFDRAQQIRRLAASLPADSIVLETDAPDIPPQWLYQTAHARANGASSRNEPAQLPRIAQTLAVLRGWSLQETARITSCNAMQALPKLRGLVS